MRSKSITTPPHARMIMVEDWMLIACEMDACAAMLLSFMIYWHDVKLAQSEQATKENEIAQSYGEQPTQNTSLMHFHNERELRLGLLGLYNEKSICHALGILVKKGFVERHTNPSGRYKFDRTRYFLTRPDVIQKWINEEYPKYDKLAVEDAIAPVRSINTTSGKITESSGKNAARSGEITARSGKNDAMLNMITSSDYSPDSFGDTHVPQTPSEVNFPKAENLLVASEVPSPKTVEPSLTTPSNVDSQEYAAQPKAKAVRKPQADSGEGKASTPQAKTPGSPVSTSLSPHQVMMTALADTTKQPILNGAAQGRAIKTILSHYTVEQGIEVLHWMADPKTNWRGKVDWLAVQNFIPEYFRRKAQQPPPQEPKPNGFNAPKRDFSRIIASLPEYLR